MEEVPFLPDEDLQLFFWKLVAIFAEFGMDVSLANEQLFIHRLSGEYPRLKWDKGERHLIYEENGQSMIYAPSLGIPNITHETII